MLGVERDASQEEVKFAYHRFVRKHHLDVAKDLKAKEMMQKTNEALRFVEKVWKRESELAR